jgi:peptidoglycan/xylan/chitin deacetylase (PgdA/CDA1 family)
MKAFLLKNIGWVAGFFAVIIIGSGIGLVSYLMPKIELIGDNPTDIVVKEQYEEKGAKAWYGNHDLTDDINIEGLVDVKKLGSYEIRYSVINIFLKANVTRIVRVIDNIGPEITLTGGNEIKLCPNEEFKEPGYIAVDNNDGDITNKVSVQINVDEVIYKVSDTSNNTTTVIRKLDRNDKEAPTIKLIGNEKVYLTVGSRYVESGYTVTDAYDKLIAEKVRVVGSVNTAVAGTYILTYEATDCSGNYAKVTRTVVVSNPVPPSSGGSGSTIYLTFDDGSSYLTPEILDILKSEGVRATFFVLGTRRNDAVWQRIVNEGHTIALHSDTHDYSQIYSSVEAYYTDLYAVRDKVKAATGVDSKILRFPGGSSNISSKNYSIGIMSYLVKDVQAKGFHYFDWNISSGDAANYTSSQIYNNVVSKLGSGSTYVVLMHDVAGNETTRDALRSIISYAKGHGYKFSNITMSTPQIHHTNLAN